MPTTRVIELKQILDGLARMRDPENEPSPEDQPLFDEAVANFLRGGPLLLDEATEFMWAYYRSVASQFGPTERASYGIPELAPGSDIWDQVEFPSNPPTLRRGGTRLEPGPSYISFEGEVTWEPEHGLQLVFEHGLRVCKVGPFDDHNTNAHAFGDESLIDVVFKD